MRRLAVLAIAVPLALAGALPAGSSPGAANGRIAYERRGFAGGSEIWTMNQDGSARRRLASGTDPAWLPDGTRIGFVEPGGRALAIVDQAGDGTSRVEISGAPYVADPAWSPDGSTIAFASSDGLYLVPATGGSARRVSGGYQPAPVWSPDGRRIAFVSAGAVTVATADGSAPVALPGARGDTGRRVAWSPDGSSIAFGDTATGGISLVRLDGSPPTPLVPYLGVATSNDPVWSPDGTRIAFVDNGADICVASVTGGRVGRLTYAPYDELRSTSANVAPAWQPLPAGATPAGPPGFPAGPGEPWDRDHGWIPACGRPPQLLRLGAVTPVRQVARGGSVTYRITVTNPSDVAAGENGLVGFAATIDGGAALVGIATSQGRCSFSAPYLDCRLGALFPGERARVTVRVRAGAPGELVLTSYLPRAASPEDGSTTPPDLLLRTRVAGCTKRGTEARDVLLGTSRGDVLCGLDGDDRIRPLAGRDTVYAGPGDDVVDARDGEVDEIACGSGDDRVLADRADRVARGCEHVTRA